MLKAFPVLRCIAEQCSPLIFDECYAAERTIHSRRYLIHHTYLKPSSGRYGVNLIQPIG